MQFWSLAIVEDLGDMFEDRAEPPEAVQEVIEHDGIEDHGPHRGIGVVVRAARKRLDPGSMDVYPGSRLADEPVPR